jgi:predicted amidohydrolase
MSDTLPVFKAAAVQASPIFLNREASVDKACALIAEAAKNDAQLIVLPETFIPGGPYWAWHLPMRECGKFSAELFQNAVDIPSDTTVRLGEAARKANAYVVIGVNERDGKSLYNTLLYFGPDGRIIGKHRKFKPTGPEKLVWGDGDGSTHKVYDTAVGKLGGLICGEHTMALPGYTLAAMGEQVHVSRWPMCPWRKSARATTQLPTTRLWCAASWWSARMSTASSASTAASSHRRRGAQLSKAAPAACSRARSHSMKRALSTATLTSTKVSRNTLYTKVPATTGRNSSASFLMTVSSKRSTSRIPAMRGCPRNPPNSSRPGERACCAPHCTLLESQHD